MVRKTTTKTTTKATNTTKAKPRRTAAVKVKTTVAESVPAPIAKKRKTNFRAGTLIAVLLLIGLLELTFYLKDKKEKDATAEATPVSETAALFSAEDSIVSSIEIKPADGDAQRVKVARNAENAWVIVLPFEAEADQGLVEAAATQVSALRVLSPISGDPEIFGLKNPAFTITIEFKDGNKHTLEVGDATPTNSGYYVRLNDKMMITDLSGIGSLLELAKYPPYLNTPTPTALPATPTPVPATEAVSTPTP